ncbi:rab GTPase-binding effector protein 2 isoform X1 [Gymnodraco acuticeps]|uniref:Rab GTPase-binding effector protein 2 n=1 Tax=Gymnodraco acuticeps TaxID=8218 RepID=A0A6P8TX05_GYMAC|nr:rab GTPase-binding effector protein 2 isoform X1 [Gymnodraco acuticeps]
MSSRSEEDSEASLQAQLAECRAQVEHWQGVATICELSKQEELAELQKQCDQEIQSLQEALRETAEQYEARLSVLQSQSGEWRRASGQNMISGRKGNNESPASLTNSLSEAVAVERRQNQPSDLEVSTEGDGTPPTSEAYFSLRHCDSASLSSFSLDTPSLPRKLHAQEDTDSLVSTGTLVPEAIYLPPAGHRLVPHGDWDALNAQVSELRGELSRLQEEKEELERELDTQTNKTHKQVSMLQAQVHTSEALLQDLQKSFSQSQSAVQSRLAELSLSQRKVSTELSRLKGEEVQDEPDCFPATLQGAHCEERLRIEIVNLRDQLDTRTEENGLWSIFICIIISSTLTIETPKHVLFSLPACTNLQLPSSEVLEVRLSSLKTETERVSSQKEQLQAELLSCRSELEALRVALSHLQSTSKTLSTEKAALQQQSLELRSQVISMRSQVDTSQTVQRDFVQLSQSLQMRLEVIRQAETLEQVREVLEEGRREAASSPVDSS